MTTKTKLRTFADLADLADSGETEGRVVEDAYARTTKIWRQVSVENKPGMLVFSARGTRWCYEVDKLRTDAKLRESIKRTAAIGRPEIHGDKVTVTFKHEDTQSGQPVGPVTVIDHALYDTDPEVAKGGIGVPFGYKPQGQHNLGWQTLRRGQQIAAYYGVTIQEW